MLEIIPFNKNIFNTLNLEKHKLTKYCYITNINLISKLLVIDLPISNRRIAIKRILDFLSYVENEVNKSNFTILQIHTDILIEYLTRDDYKSYMDILSDLNVLSKVPYEDGSFYTIPIKKLKGKSCSKKTNIGDVGRPNQYRVHNDYLKEEDLAIVVLEEDRSKFEFRNEIPELDIKYIDTIKKLEVNIPKAIEAEIKHFEDNNLSIDNLRKRISRMFGTRRNRFIKKGKKVDRIYHSFSNVSRITRKHLNINLYDIDIVNCQPLLLVAYLQSNNLPFDKQYQSDCEEGNFYEKFLDINKPQNISELEWRTPTKVSIYKSIYFGFNVNSKHNKRFKELYPLTWESLLKIKDEPISLAQHLQNLEAELFNNLIPHNSKYYFTLFDAIYFDSVLDKYKLEKIVRDYFNQFEIKVKIK